MIRHPLCMQKWLLMAPCLQALLNIYLLQVRMGKDECAHEEAGTEGASDGHGSLRDAKQAATVRFGFWCNSALPLHPPSPSPLPLSPPSPAPPFLSAVSTIIPRHSRTLRLGDAVILLPEEAIKSNLVGPASAVHQMSVPIFFRSARAR